MRIHQEFIGGNIHVVSREGDCVHLENQLRDTQGDWFYWAFCVEGAEGQTLTFHMQPNRLGYFGPAVSCDLVNWHWLGRVEGDTFTYTFAPDEGRVYFAHNMLYHPARFSAFCEKKGMTPATLCVSRRGREVPCLTLGEGKRTVFLTARHHACESTGSYVLEGVLDELSRHPLPDVTVFCVPFVDYDGVLDGDQGKGRAPHDHNREYDFSVPAIYPETAAIRARAEAQGVCLGFDFHSPWHKGGHNDTAFIVQNSIPALDRQVRFGQLLEEEITPDALPYRQSGDFPPETEWNHSGPQFALGMQSFPTCLTAFTLETAYFGKPDCPVSEQKLLGLGRAFGRAIGRYLAENS